MADITESADVVIINCETGEVEKRAYTAEEIAQKEADLIQFNNEKAQAEAEAQAKAEAKASALAKLAALGLTEDEAKAIVG
jgi:hypothetical protein